MYQWHVTAQQAWILNENLTQSSLWLYDTADLFLCKHIKKDMSGDWQWIPRKDQNQRVLVQIIIVSIASLSIPDKEKIYTAPVKSLDTLSIERESVSKPLTGTVFQNETMSLCLV